MDIDLYYNKQDNKYYYTGCSCSRCGEGLGVSAFHITYHPRCEASFSVVFCINCSQAGKHRYAGVLAYSVIRPVIVVSCVPDGCRPVIPVRDPLRVVTNCLDAVGSKRVLGNVDAQVNNMCRFAFSGESFEGASIGLDPAEVDSFRLENEDDEIKAILSAKPMDQEVLCYESSKDRDKAC